MPEKPTRVLFRIDTFEVTAVFPDEPADELGNNMVCYAHVGQHSGCSMEWYHTTRAARLDQYIDLKRELQSIGYVLDVRQRMPSNARDIRSPSSSFASFDKESTQ